MMELVSTHLVKKSDLGTYGNLFGGQLMKWLDIAGASYAMQVCDSPRVVTISIDRCEFKKPAKEGQIVKMYASVYEIGRTSVTLRVEARSHNVYSGEQRIIVSTHIKFVRIDEEGNPIAISNEVRLRNPSLLRKE
jgi:acyl-CoA thioesterase YciA